MPISKIPGKGTQDLFNNISDAGTEGTKVAVGTTAQRGSTTGQWRFNSDTGFFEGRNNTGAFSTLEPTPTVTGVDVTEVDSAAGGDQTIVVTGTNFSSGGTIAFVGTSAQFNAATTTFNSTTQVTAVAPKASFLNAQEPYKVKFSSASGISGQSESGLINVDTAPTWNTSAGSLGNVYDNVNANHFTLSATDAEGDTVAYSETGATNITGAGLSLNSSTGVISGDANDVGGDTTVSFTGRATAGGKTADRAFSFVVKPALGTSSNPATSAKQLYDAGYTTDGIYYFNNFLTGGQDKQAYARFDVKDSLNTNKLHLQRIDPGHLSNHAIRNYTNSGSHSLTRQSGNATDSTVGAGSTYTYTANSSTGSGCSSMVDTGLTLSQLHGYTLAFELHQTSIGDGNNSLQYGFDFSSSINGGNYGHNYVPDIYLGNSKTQEVKYYLQAINFVANGSETTVQKNALGGQYRHATNSTVWSNFYSDSGDKTDISNGSETINSSQTAEYIGIRFGGWADHTTDKTGYYAIWAGITGS